MAWKLLLLVYRRAEAALNSYKQGTRISGPDWHSLFLTLASLPTLAYGMLLAVMLAVALYYVTLGRKGMPRKKGPPKKPDIGHQAFLDEAGPLQVAIAGQVMNLMPRVFSTGSIGWTYNNTGSVHVKNKPVGVMFALSVIVSGSKPAVGKALTQDLREASNQEDED